VALGWSVVLNKKNPNRKIKPTAIAETLRRDPKMKFMMTPMKTYAQE
jgi:hypothetical protein